MLDLKMTTKDTADVVVTCDPAVEAAWEDETSRTLYAWTGKAPAPLPRDATVFTIRPLGWAERRSAREASFSGRYSAKGAELRGTYREKMKESAEAADEWRRGLSLEERREIDLQALLQLEHDEKVCAACVVEVRSGSVTLTWDQLLDRLTDGTAASTVIREVARHIWRISTVSEQASF